MLKNSKIEIEQHFSPSFYAELWGVSTSTVLRWFQDHPGALKLNEAPKRGKRARVELRIPLSVAQEEYRRRTRGE